MRHYFLSLVPALCLAAASAPAQDATPSQLPLRLNAFAVNMTGGGARNAGTLEISIERWSSDEERSRLRDLLVEKGGEGLLDAVQKIKPRAGYVRGTATLGWDIHYAREFPLPEGGRRIIFGTDRPMSFWELRNSARSTDYEFMLCEIRLNAEGKGQGKLATAAKVGYNKDTNTIEIENYGIEPVRLTQVLVQGQKKKKDGK